MTGLFRFKRDDGRWKFFCLTGISVIALTYLPSLSSKQAEGSSQSPPDAHSSSVSQSETLSQADDLFHNRAPNRLQMTSTQIEQARATLIRRGFSPVQAETILPTRTRP